MLLRRLFHHTPFRRFQIQRCLSTSRPFKILGLQQVAIGHTDRLAHETLWMDCLGLKSNERHTLPKENVEEDICILGDGVEIDLMVPIDPEKSPKVHSSSAGWE